MPSTCGTKVRTDTRSKSKSVRLCRAPPQTRMKEGWHQRGPECLITCCQIVGYLPFWQLEPVVPFCWALRVTCLNQSSSGINQELEEDKRVLPLCEPLSAISHKLAARLTHCFRASLWHTSSTGAQTHWLHTFTHRYTCTLYMDVGTDAHRLHLHTSLSEHTFS